MEALTLAFTTGWASGINAYARVLALGLLGPFADIRAWREKRSDSATGSAAA